MYVYVYEHMCVCVCLSVYVCVFVLKSHNHPLILQGPGKDFGYVLVTYILHFFPLGFCQMFFGLSHVWFPQPVRISAHSLRLFNVIS